MFEVTDLTRRSLSQPPRHFLLLIILFFKTNNIARCDLKYYQRLVSYSSHLLVHSLEAMTLLVLRCVFWILPDFFSFCPSRQTYEYTYLVSVLFSVISFNRKYFSDLHGRCYICFHVLKCILNLMTF